MKILVGPLPGAVSRHAPGLGGSTDKAARGQRGSRDAGRPRGRSADGDVLLRGRPSLRGRGGGEGQGWPKAPGPPPPPRMIRRKDAGRRAGRGRLGRRKRPPAGRKFGRGKPRCRGTRLTPSRAAPRTPGRRKAWPKTAGREAWGKSLPGVEGRRPRRALVARRLGRRRNAGKGLPCPVRRQSTASWVRSAGWCSCPRRRR